jgi:hypothetical protein
VIHISRLITIAENPRMMTRSLKKGNRTTVPGVASGVAFLSNFEKMTNNKKQILQMKVNLEKNEINFIKIVVLKKLSAK